MTGVPTDQFRLATWNIRKASRSRAEAVAATVDAFDADVTVLTEYRARESCPIRNALDERDLATVTMTGPGEVGILIASRFPIEDASAVGPSSAPYRWVRFRCPGPVIDVIGVYILGVLPKSPSSANRAERQVLFDNLRDLLSDLRQGPTVVLGDFNSGEPSDSSKDADYFDPAKFSSLLADGWTSALRHMDGPGPSYSWWHSAGSGFLIDHALVAPSLVDDLRDARLVTAADGRHLVRVPGEDDCQLAPVSDHAALLVDLDRRRILQR